MSTGEKRRKGDDDEDPGDFFGPGDFGEVPELPTEPAGQWMGRGCIALGLSGIVLPDELKPLMQGLHPFTGAELVQNAGRVNRVPGWDFTFSEPKTVSIVWTQADESMRLKIERARGRALMRRAISRRALARGLFWLLAIREAGLLPG